MERMQIENEVQTKPYKNQIFRGYLEDKPAHGTEADPVNSSGSHKWEETLAPLTHWAREHYFCEDSLASTHQMQEYSLHHEGQKKNMSLDMAKAPLEGKIITTALDERSCQLHQTQLNNQLCSDKRSDHRLWPYGHRVPTEAVSVSHWERQLDQIGLQSQ